MGNWIESIKLISFQLNEVYNTLLEKCNSTKNPIINNEANLLTNNEFVLSIVI